MASYISLLLYCNVDRTIYNNTGRHGDSGGANDCGTCWCLDADDGVVEVVVLMKVKVEAQYTITNSRQEWHGYKQ